MKRICVALSCLLINQALCLAQDAPAPPKTTAPATIAPAATAPPDLTDGLLDLLREPVENKTPKADRPGVPAKDVPSVPGSKTGEDIGQGPEHPLVPVQQSMVQLADWLRNGSEPQKTQQLQRDVVLRLDELIAQMQQQQSQSKSQSGSSSSSSQSASQSQSAGQPTGQPGEPSSPAAGQRQGNSQLANKAGTPADSAAPTSPNRNGTEPGQPGGDPPTADGNQPGGESQPGSSPLGNRQVVIDLNDPTALQRSAWGSLPERMREQMQSRMVERFLPGYREDIEAYYRALAK